MEGVRGRAQGAIDQANAMFQAYRADATSHLDAAIHYLQSRFFSYAVSPSLHTLHFLTRGSCRYGHSISSTPCILFWLAQL